MALIIGEYDYHFVFQVLKPAESLEMIVPIDPTVREADGANYVELAKLFMAVHAVSASVDYDYILVRQVEKLLQILVRGAHIWLFGGAAAGF